jgi:hypothetical protein
MKIARYSNLTASQTAQFLASHFVSIISQALGLLISLVGMTA